MDNLHVVETGIIDLTFILEAEDFLEGEGPSRLEHGFLNFDLFLDLGVLYGPGLASS